MQIRPTRLSLVCLALALAVALALLSVLVERVGPELVPYGNLCGPSQMEPCYKPVLKGGFPVSYLFDAPGVSRERQLAFIEDNLHPAALVVDMAVYFVAMLLVVALTSRRWFTHKRAVNDADA